MVGVSGWGGWSLCFFCGVYEALRREITERERGGERKMGGRGGGEREEELNLRLVDYRDAIQRKPLHSFSNPSHSIRINTHSTLYYRHITAGELSSPGSLTRGILRPSTAPGQGPC